MQVVILCGGLGTRVYPLTLKNPKSLIDINGRPFIYYQLKLLQKNGFSNILLCVGKHGKMIEEYIKDGSNFHMNVEYSYEDKNSLLGTGGAIRNALDLLQDEFIILYGDSYLPVDFFPIIEKFKSEDKSMLMTIYKNNNEYGNSNILYKDGRILKYTKRNLTPDMQHIEYGITIVKKVVFSSYERERFDLEDLMSSFVFLGDVSVFEVHERFYEIGSFSGIEDFKTYLNK